MKKNNVVWGCRQNMIRINLAITTTQKTNKTEKNRHETKGNPTLKEI